MDTLTKHQRSVLRGILDGQNVCVTGAAGTGKSVLLKAVAPLLPRSVVVAATGIAALNVGGSTAHSFLGIGAGRGTVQDWVDKNESNFFVKKRINGAKTLLLDEISMFSGRFLDMISEYLKEMRGSKKPFGGLQIVAFGDFLQLPPVPEDNSIKEPFAFESKAWREAKIKTYTLTEVLRQNEAEFVFALADIRKGLVSEAAMKLFSTRIGAIDSSPEIAPVHACPKRWEVESYNAEKLDEITSPERLFKARDWMKNPSEGMRARLDSACPAAVSLVLKKGAQVMLLANLDVSKGLVNGTLGIVREVEPKLKVKFEGVLEVQTLERFAWEIEHEKKVVAFRSQYPLMLAWAITIHKLQGKTLSKVQVKLSSVFTEGQAYVALSRSKTLQGLYLDDFRDEFVSADKRALLFHEKAEKDPCGYAHE